MPTPHAGLISLLCFNNIAGGRADKDQHIVDFLGTIEHDPFAGFHVVDFEFEALVHIGGDNQANV